MAQRRPCPAYNDRPNARSRQAASPSQDAGRSQTSPSQNQNSDSDSDSSENSSGEYTDAADEYEADYFLIPTRRMFCKFLPLTERFFQNTRHIHMPTLRDLGVDQDFFNLTTRVGFTPAFWAINHKSYAKLTHEFLSSLELKEKGDGTMYIKFRLLNVVKRVNLSDVRAWFGFHPQPQKDNLVFRGNLNKEGFWKLIAGTDTAQNKDYKARLIQHPTLRVVQRVLACTIFARGETINRVNNEELTLIDNMLQTGEEFKRPDLAFVMVTHWLWVRDQKRTKGIITIGAYVSLIAKKLCINLGEEDVECGGPTVMNHDHFQSADFIKIRKGTAGHGPQYWWLMGGRKEFQLPYERGININDPSTWLIPQAAARQAALHTAVPQEELPEPMQQDPHPQQPPHNARCRQVPPATWFTDILAKLTDMQNMQIVQRAEIRDILRISMDNSARLNDIMRKLDNIDQQLYEQRFYYNYGYYPGGSDDPNLYPDEGSSAYQ